MWAQSKGLLGEQVSFGGRGARGFALGAAGSPEVWGAQTADQKAWIVATLTKLNDLIYQSTNTTCSTWAPPSVAGGAAAATKCFQPWYNSMYVGSPGFVQLRTDGVFDADTLQALITTALIHQADFPTAYPASAKKMSYGKMVGIGAAVATVGGVIYAATRGKKKSARRRR